MTGANRAHRRLTCYLCSVYLVPIDQFSAVSTSYSFSLCTIAPHASTHTHQHQHHHPHSTTSQHLLINTQQSTLQRGSTFNRSISDNEVEFVGLCSNAKQLVSRPRLACQTSFLVGSPRLQDRFPQLNPRPAISDPKVQGRLLPSNMLKHSFNWFPLSQKDQVIYIPKYVFIRGAALLLFPFRLVLPLSFPLLPSSKQELIGN